MNLIGITRVRNEALIIADTIGHFLEYCDEIILYDDCSEDDTVGIAKDVGGTHLTVIHGDRWRTDRIRENTRHRYILLNNARDMGADWCLCFDADERLVGELPPLVGSGYQFRLFDGYLTKTLHESFQIGHRLTDLPRMWGPEYRDITMLFRADRAAYRGSGRREPFMSGPIALAPIKVKHYGKCLSVEHWEETCHYYSTYFPNPFRDKWEARKGKAIHVRSDFGRPLFTWDELMTIREEWAAI